VNAATHFEIRNKPGTSGAYAAREQHSSSETAKRTAIRPAGTLMTLGSTHESPIRIRFSRCFYWRRCHDRDGPLALLLRQLGIPSLNFAFLGRWIGHLPRGRWIHEGIAKAAPIKGELWMGWFAHYSIGVTFAILLLAVYGLEWARKPSLPPALIIGIMTVVGPLFILQPALGAGIASSKTPKPVFNPSRA
jgi:hypothetical protein